MLKYVFVIILSIIANVVCSMMPLSVPREYANGKWRNVEIIDESVQDFGYGITKNIYKFKLVNIDTGDVKIIESDYYPYVHRNVIWIIVNIVAIIAILTFIGYDRDQALYRKYPRLLETGFD